MGSDYGLWPLVVINTLLVLAFAVSFYHPTNTARDWTVMGGFSAFLVALFTEMYGFPLTVYLVSGWLGSRFPLLRADHRGGHLLNDLIGWDADPHVSPFHLASYAFIGGGFWLITAAWQVLHQAARSRRLAVEGPYAWLRHPQYLGFLLVMLGFLLQWPTIPTLAMFPVLALVYARLARREERTVAQAFGPAWDQYAATVPAYRPRRPPPATPTDRQGAPDTLGG
ncbi:isoprenylcysteine carboxylmethyltransferase family protein [Kineosporia sp. R_H_3]|uniref:methyltransferase family protein n=1 Tax=Kineosporia sp. R_H_3 TaxID=1961848 RepID=UPI000B4ACC05|nr:isoprenylcysteine carboxylmethyltransferase family protein [Kineosporia sp. R_H_3]